ncbi:MULTISPECIES: type IV pilus modification protein PilV [unclassified Thioalkalivibrio]|uniref:type IV pilus modification protein PilV n=1 Tax=unclassified Thioalkalivibrio TaxID=2621013 RepID=UPI0005703D2F|nr:MULTISPECIES: type IV pilus modification protein PilV [unclassified Thioalkalivibrio]
MPSHSLPVVRLARARGVTLIEVLVALVVLSIGVIGLAALQAQALQMNQGAYMRAQATNLAYDIADRMRTNRAAALDGTYDTSFQSPPDCEAPGTGPDLASADLTQWRVALACALPEGQGRIERNGDVFTITIRWDNRRLVEDGEEPFEEFVTRTGI